MVFCSIEQLLERDGSEQAEWAAFVEESSPLRPTEDELRLIRTRVPFPCRPPTATLYKALLLLHRGAIELEDFENVVDVNERLYRQARAWALRSTFSVVK
jgi:hypothetical protein